MKKRAPLFFALLWLAMIGGGMGILLVYDFTPGGDEAGVPKQWVASSGIPRRPDLPTLVMFAHPKCPCTRASVAELAVLMARCQGRVNANVVFFHPKGAAEDWSQTDLWSSAAAIPGVTVRQDDQGREAENFHVNTSGHTVLYGAGGRRLFSGGITESRGHEGDNAGVAAIVDQLNHGQTVEQVTPTFGCSLLNPKAKDVALQTICQP